MAYAFVDRSTGKAGITIQGTTTTINLAGVNTKTTDADKFYKGIEILVGLVGWTTSDINRVVTQDVESTSG